MIASMEKAVFLPPKMTSVNQVILVLPLFVLPPVVVQYPKIAMIVIPVLSIPVSTVSAKTYPTTSVTMASVVPEMSASKIPSMLLASLVTGESIYPFVDLSRAANNLSVPKERIAKWSHLIIFVLLRILLAYLHLVVIMDVLLRIIANRRVKDVMGVLRVLVRLRRISA
jgi:hypothetical protein